jgi:hypothetical protein
MSEWDVSVVETRNQGQTTEEFKRNRPANLLRSEALGRFKDFIRGYREGAVFVLRFVWGFPRLAIVAVCFRVQNGFWV